MLVHIFAFSISCFHLSSFHAFSISLNGIKISQNNLSPTVQQTVLANCAVRYYLKGKLFLKRPLSLAHMSKWFINNQKWARIPALSFGGFFSRFIHQVESYEALKLPGRHNPNLPYQVQSRLEVRLIFHPEWQTTTCGSWKLMECTRHAKKQNTCSAEPLHVKNSGWDFPFID